MGGTANPAFSIPPCVCVCVGGVDRNGKLHLGGCGHMRVYIGFIGMYDRA